MSFGIETTASRQLQKIQNKTTSWILDIQEKQENYVVFFNIENPRRPFSEFVLFCLLEYAAFNVARYSFEQIEL